MPNIKSAKKRVKVLAKRSADNQAAKSDLKTAIKKAQFALANSTEDKEAVVKLAVKTIDQASAKGLLHKNNAARKKSQLAVKLNHNA
ncbi:MAG: 30S ribosomal protein S20 [Angelakisella sp.]